ncbi:MAG: hypothetical protein OXH19_09080 [Chloroflexi bacterium]|nr:hypothetical protein [Chloroflexota bacterium]MCY3587695.1 hypothetical protein [Chloroflexota bacterium]MCY3686312.1 hypothetical protein [Chloroflexota bacterium]MDE2708933.1 hypothetical protein [Chloroflexota bacterium]
MTIQQPPDATAEELLSAARELAWSDDESAAADAYDCAIKAIECAFVPVMAGDGIDYNLADVVMTLRSRREPWGTPFRNQSALDSMMSLLNDLWHARPYRDDLIPVSLETTRMAITIADAAVSLAKQGFFEYLGELTPEEEAEDVRIAEENLAWYEAHGEDDVISFEDYLKGRAEQDDNG